MDDGRLTGVSAAKPQVSFDRNRILHGDYSPRPAAEALLWCHRTADQESFVRAFVKNPSTGRTVFWSVAANRLGAWIRSNRRRLWQDSYVSINSFFRRGTHRERDLRYLNAAAVDLDCYGVPAGKVVDRIEEIVRQGLVPAPTFVQRSHGWWLCWLLREVKSDRPLHWSPGGGRLLRAVNEALASTIERAAPELQVDRGSVDPCRFLRVPGSTNSRAPGRPVTYSLVCSLDGTTPYSYALETIARDLGVELPAAPRVRLEGSTRTRRVPRRGGSVVHRQRLADLKALERSRGGFSSGCRNVTALYLSLSLRGLGKTEDELEEELGAYASRCQPPLSKWEYRDAIKASRKKYLPRNRTIAARLRVTIEEAERLCLRQIRPDFLPKQHKIAGRYVRKPEEQRYTDVRCRKSERLIAIANVVDRRGGVPSLRTMNRILHRHGIHASRTQLARDYHSLGYKR